MSLRIDRSPDFFALCRCRGDGYTLVAEHDGDLLGCISVARRPGYLLGTAKTMGYVGDAKVHPDFRGAGIARALLQAVHEEESRRSPIPYAASVAAGNGAIGAVLERFGASFPLLTLSHLTAYQLLPLFAGSVEAEVSHATEQDRDELAALLDDAHRHYTFGPVFRDGGLDEILSRSPGMDLSSYWLMRRGRRICAALALWDQHAIKQTHVLRLTRALRWASRATRPAAALGLPALPQEGDELRFRYVRHAAGDRQALGALVRAALAEARRRREHFLLFTCADTDPLSSCLTGIARTAYRYTVVVGTNRALGAAPLEQLTGTPTYDDPALS